MGPDVWRLPAWQDLEGVPGIAQESAVAITCGRGELDWFVLVKNEFDFICSPGPLFALVGNGVTVIIVAIGSAMAGTWVYGVPGPRRPHSLCTTDFHMLGNRA